MSRQTHRHREGWEVAVGLLAAASSLFAELHARLAAEGHPDLRPAHGYAFQAIGAGGATATELGERLGITKQAAGQMARELVRLGYLRVEVDSGDARRRPLALTARGEDALARSAAVFEQLRDEWAVAVGPRRVDAAADALDALVGLYGLHGPLRPVW